MVRDDCALVSVLQAARQLHRQSHAQLQVGAMHACFEHKIDYMFPLPLCICIRTQPRTCEFVYFQFSEHVFQSLSQVVLLICEHKPRKVRIKVRNPY